jgi:hypothetical protein
MNMMRDCQVSFAPLHSKDWEAKLERIEILRSSQDGKVEFWIVLVGSETKVYFQLRLPNNDDLLATMEVTTDLQPRPSWETLVQYDETGRGRCFADVYVLLRQLGFDRWMLHRGAEEPYRYGLRSWT